jgi:hypothetical protein
MQEYLYMNYYLLIVVGLNEIFQVAWLTNRAFNLSLCREIFLVFILERRTFNIFIILLTKMNRPLEFIRKVRME